MSPLVRSLLALAALLAAARAQNNCNELLIGSRSPLNSFSDRQLLPFDIPSWGATVDIKNHCGYQNLRGETVYACNKDPNGTPPIIEARPPGQLEHVLVQCLIGGVCLEGFRVSVTQHCNFLPNP